MPSDTSQELKVTTADQWKGVAAEGQVIALPSGNNVRVRRTMDLIELLKTGRIPNPLGTIVRKMIDQGSRAQLNPADLSPEVLVEMVKLVDKTVLQAVTEPRVQAPPEEPEEGESEEAFLERRAAWTPEEGCIPLAYLDVTDRMYIFTFAQGFAADLESFREQTHTAMERLSDGGSVPPKAKRTSRSK